MDPQTYHSCRLFRFLKMIVEYFDSVPLNRSVHFATQSQAVWATRVSCQFGRAVVCGNSTTHSCLSLQPSPGFVVSSVSVWAEAYCALYGNAINDPAKHEEPPWQKSWRWDRMERMVRRYRSWWPLELLSWLSWSLPQGLVNVPCWFYWTSPYSSHLVDNIPNGWVMWKMGTWLMTHVHGPCQVIYKEFLGLHGWGHCVGEPRQNWST